MKITLCNSICNRTTHCGAAYSLGGLQTRRLQAQATHLGFVGPLIALGPTIWGPSGWGPTGYRLWPSILDLLDHSTILEEAT